MKTYMIVTNDAYELPVSGEIVGAAAVAERLGIKVQRLRRCLLEGFPRKAKYKAVVIKERQIEDKEQYQKDYALMWRFKVDRTEYHRQWYQRKKLMEASKAMGKVKVAHGECKTP